MGVMGYSVNAGSTGSWTCMGAVPNVTCTTLSSVPASGNLMLLLDVTLASNVSSPLAANSATASNPGDTTPGNNGPASSGTTPVTYTFDLTIAKVAQGTFTGGGSGQYKITVSNAGPSNSTGTTTVTDTLPAGITGYSVNAGSTAGWSCSGAVPNVTCTNSNSIAASGNSMLLLDIQINVNAANPLPANTATVSNPGDSNNGNNGPASSGTTPLSSSFDLSVTKSAFGTFTAGGTGTYQISVNNAGPSNSTGTTTVTETLPAGVTGYSVGGGSTPGWSCTGSVLNVTCTNPNSIPAGGPSVLFLVVNIASNVAGNLASNTVSVSNPGDANPGNNGPASSGPTRVVTSFDLATTKTTVGTFTAGGAGKYKMTVTNNGPSDSSGTTTLNDLMPAGITAYSVNAGSSAGWTCSGAAPNVVCNNANVITAGGNSMVILDVTISPNAPTPLAGNQVTVSNPNECATCTGNNGPVSLPPTPLGMSFDLTVAKVAQGTFTTGGTGQYKITVSNAGPSNSSGITTVAETLPAGITGYAINGASSAGWTCTGAVPNVNCDNGSSIPPGGNIVLLLDVTISPNASSPLAGNTVSITNPSECAGCTTGNGPITTAPTPLSTSFDLTVAKTASAMFVAGGTGQYTVTVHNNGPSNSSGTTTVNETFPAGVTGYAINAGSTAGWSCAGAVPGVICTNSSVIPSGGNSLLIFDVNISAGASNPLPANTVSISNPNECPTCGAGNGPVSTPPTTLNSVFDLTVAKTAQGTFTAGGSGQYKITVTNAGPSNSTGTTTVAEALPAGVTAYAVNAGSTTGWACTGTVPNVSCTNPNVINSGANSILLLDIIISANAANPLPANIISVSNPSECSTCLADNGPFSTPTVPLTTNFDLTITKQAVGTFTAGGSGQYKITVANAGPSNSTGTTTVTDTLPAGIISYGVNPVSTPGWTCTGTPPSLNCQNANSIPASGSSMLVLDVMLASSATSPLAPNNASVSNPNECPTCGGGNGPASSGTTPVTTNFDLTIAKTASGTFTAGGTGQYQITVSNAGPSNSSGTTTVNESLPAGITGYAVNAGSTPGWTCVGAVPNVVCTNSNPITAGGASSLLLDVNIAANVAGIIPANSVTVTNPNECATCAGNNGPATTGGPTPITTNFDLTVAKVAQGTFTPGGTGQYKITVSNGGPSNSTGTTTVTELLPAGITGYSVNLVSSPGWTCAGAVPNVTCTDPNSIPSGGNSMLILDVTLAANASSPLGGNTVSISNPNECAGCTAGNGPVSTPPTPVLANFDLSITKTAQGTFTAGGTGQYLITVANAGPSNSTGTTTVTETFPAGITGYAINAASSPGWSCSGAGPNVSCTNGNSIIAGGNITLRLDVSIAAGASGTVGANSVALSNPNECPTCGGGNGPVVTPPTPVANSFDLTVAKQAVGNFVAGSTGIYQITVTNNGPSNSTGTTTVTDNLPGGLTLNSFSGTGWSCSGATNVVCTNPNSIAANASSTVTLVVNIPANLTGPINNAASVSNPNECLTCGGNNGPVPQTGGPITVLNSFDLSVAKQSVGTFTAGGTGIYQITVTNNGPSNSTGLTTVTDNLQSGMTLSSFSGTGWTCTGTTNVVCTNPNVIVANASSVLTLMVNIPSTLTGTVSNVASVSNPNECPTCGGNNGSGPTPPTPVTAGNADLVIQKNGPATVIANGTVNYTITATNLGPQAAHGARIMDTPTGVSLTGISCTATGGAVCPGAPTVAQLTGVGLVIPSFPAGSQITLSLTATAPASGSISNTARILTPAGVIEVDSTNNTTSPVNTTVAAPVPTTADLAINKVGTTQIAPGGQVTYVVTVANGGPAAANGATVNDAVPAALTGVNITCLASGGAVCPNTAGLTTLSNVAIPTLPAFGSVVFTITGTAPASGTLSNSATVAPPVGITDPNSANNGPTTPATTSITPPPNTADLVIAKTGPGTVGVGGTITYTINAANLGPAVANGAVISDQLPAGVTGASAICSASGGAVCGAVSISSGLLSATLTSFPVGGSVDIIVTCTAPASGNLVNFANIKPPAGVSDPNPRNNVGGAAITSVTLLGPSAFSAGLLDPLACSSPGNTATGFAVLTNPNAVPVNATLVFNLPAGLLAQTCTAASGTCTVTNASTINWAGTLSPNQSLQINYTAQIAPNVAMGTTLCATTTATFQGGAPQSVQACLTVNCPVDDLAITKTNGTNTITPGQQTTYTIVVRNNGPDSINQATVRDTLPAALTNATWTCTASVGSVCNAPSGTGSISTTVNLSPNGTATFTLTATVSITASGTVANTATVSTPKVIIDPNPANNVATDTDTVTPSADLSIKKTAGASTAVPNNPFSYTIVVTNNGQSAVIGASVVDAFDPKLTNVSWTCTASVGSACGAASGTGNIATTVNLLNGGAATFLATATVAPTATGTITNVASVAPPAGVVDPNPNNNSNPPLVTPIGAGVDLAITKSHTGVFQVGQTGNYLIRVRNASQTSTTGAITVTDTLPNGLVFVAASGGDWTCGVAGQTVTCTNFGPITSGSASEITLTVFVTDRAFPAVTNTATVATLADTNAANNAASDPTVVENGQGLQGAPYPAGSQISDQKAGSILVFPIYTSDAVNGTTQNTRIALTNTDPTRSVAVHLFFVDGVSCSIADSYICLTAQQTTSFQASDIDPGTTGYVIAVAVNSQGCPIIFNELVGDEYVKFAAGHAANLGAEAISALPGLLGLNCTLGTGSATINFDGVMYNALPRVLTLDNIGSRADGNDTLLIVDRIGGNLGTGCATLGTLFGLLYNDSETGVSFQIGAATGQFRGTISNNSPRTTPRFEQFITAGRSGWMKLYGGTDIGIIGVAINHNANASSSAGAFRQGHNLHKLTLTTSATLALPIFPPSCQ